MHIHSETDRLVIRPIVLEDAPFILELVNTKGWIQYIGDRSVADLGDARDYIADILKKDNSFYNVFSLKETQQPIGIVTFLHREAEQLPDFGFAILPQFEKNGYTSEASQVYLNRLTESKVHSTIAAITKKDNQKSIALLKKLKFQYVKDFQKEQEILSLYHSATQEKT